MLLEIVPAIAVVCLLWLLWAIGWVVLGGRRTHVRLQDTSDRLRSEARHRSAALVKEAVLPSEARVKKS